MQAPTDSRTPSHPFVNALDERGLMLEEVNFKWLMAGVGWWVDMSRFRSDPLYANYYLNLAKTSDSIELRSCAGQLQQQMGLDG